MENKNLTLGSLFDGSGGFPLGGLLAGIEPVWASEIAPFPIRVTTKRLPQMKHYGDVSKLNGAELPPVDVVTFGSPCQDLSLAGKRYGLSGSRSNLFYEAVRIVKEMRCATNGKYPRFIVWENVPGAFSSNKGQDFRAVLDAICKVKRKDYAVPEPPNGKWTNSGEIVGENFSLAWRVFDAQYWGVPQRRKRIFLVADFAEQCAGKILFESEGMSGYSPKSVCPWQGTSGSAEKSTGKTGISIDGYNGSVSNQASTLGVNCGMSTGRNGVMVLNDQGGNRMDLTENKTCTLRAEAHHPPLVFENHSQDTRYTQLDNVAPTVLSTYGTGGNNQPFVLETPKTLKIRSGCDGGGKGALIQDDKSATLSCNNDQTLFVPKCYGICSKNSNSMKSDNSNSGFYEAQTSRCIDANGGNPSCNQGGMAVVAVQGSVIGRKDKNGPQGSGIDENVSFTLNTVDKHAVAYGIDRAAFNQGKNAKFGICIEEEIEPPIVARGANATAVPVYSTSKNSHHTIAEKELANTLVATDYKDPPVVNDTEYIVRRLTPTECARLQGFPDWWCSDLGTENPTDEEIKNWQNIFDEYNKAVGKNVKPKSEKQIIKWLKNPHSDSEEYKMWGNGLCLNISVMIMCGIKWAANNEGS